MEKVSKVFNKVFAFFSNKWTKFGFSFVSAGYLWFLGWVAWLTFNHHFVFENAAAVFLLYTFINVMFTVVMIYTKRCIITRIVTLFMHPFILVMLIYGFGNWYLLLPAFIAATVVFFASGANESLKVILGTIYMILFVLAFLAYVTVEMLTIPIPYKMDLELRTAELQVNSESDTFRVVAYVSDPGGQSRRTASFFIERTDLDLELWNMTAERIGRVRLGTAPYDRITCDEDRLIITWISGNVLSFDGRHFEVSEEGEITVLGNQDEDDEDSDEDTDENDENDGEGDEVQD
jgi:hypothetical protein